MIRTLAFDLDGALLDEHSRLTGRTRGALLRCRERGIKLAVATGRGSAARLAARHICEPNDRDDMARWLEAHLL